MTQRLITYNLTVKLFREAFKNAIDLHLDSMFLFKNKSYPRAFALSVLAMEEFGKYVSMDRLAFYSFHDKNFLEESIDRDFVLSKYIKGIFTQHGLKQKSYVANLFHDMKRREFSMLMKKIENKRIDTMKQNALYVGVQISKSKKYMFSGVYIPKIKITKSNAFGQVNFVNDWVLRLIEGKLIGYLHFDDQVISRILWKKLYNQIQSFDHTRNHITPWK